MTDVDVTLTDYALAILCGWLALASHRTSRPPIRGWLVAFFAAAGAAPLLGGTVHGFFEAEGTTGHAILWPATLLAIGAAAVAAWGLGARVGGGRFAGAVTAAALASFPLYAVFVLSGADDFRVAVLYYLPAVVSLTASFGIAYRREPTRARRLALVGLLLSFAAAAVQQLRVPIHPRFFDHNALYHLIQAAGFVAFYRGAREE